MSPTTLLQTLTSSITTPTTTPSLSPRELPPTITLTSTPNSTPSLSASKAGAFAIVIGIFFIIGLTLCCCLARADKKIQSATTTQNQNPYPPPNQIPTQYQNGNPYQNHPQHQYQNQISGQEFCSFPGGSGPIERPRPTQNPTFGTEFTSQQYGRIPSGVTGRDAMNGNGPDNSIEGERIELENMRQKVRALEQKLEVADPPPVYQPR